MSTTKSTKSSLIIEPDEIMMDDISIVVGGTELIVHYEPASLIQSVATLPAHNKKSSSKTEIITKDTISRLLRDVKNIMKNPLTDNGIYYIHDDEDLLKGYALIVGPSDTPYFGGNYFFEFNFPTDYPHSPPKIIYCTNGDGIRFNPNLYTSGKVCVSILNTWRGEQWTSCQTISTVLLTLCTLLCENPLLNEPGITDKHADFIKYNKIIEYKNVDIAVLKIVEKHPDIYPNKFSSFYPFVKENFIKNKDVILKFLIERKNNKEEKICTGMYSMNVIVDYNKLYNTFLQTCKNILSEEKELITHLVI